LTATPKFRSRPAHDQVILDVRNLREVGPVESAGLIRECQAMLYKRYDPAIWRAMDELASGSHNAVFAKRQVSAPAGASMPIAAAVARERSRFFARFRAEFDAILEARRAGAPRAWGKGGRQARALALVEEGDLSGQVALKNAVLAMRAATRKEGFAFNLRTRAVMREQPNHDDYLNPWGAELTCDALGSTCRALWPATVHWHCIMEHVVRVLTPEIVQLHKEQNALLQQHDILPKLQVRTRKRTQIAPAARAKEGNLYEQVTALFAPQALPVEAKDGAATPRDLRLTLARAFYLLDARSAGHTEDFAMRQPGAASGLAALAGIMVADGGPTLDPITIEILTAVLNEVFDNPHLPAEIKTLFGRLQIPLLKAALIDPGALSQPGNGVRKFFDALAAAAVGLRPGIEEDADFLALANHLVAEIRDQPGDNLGQFTAARMELELFLDVERAQYNSRVEQALPPLVAMDEQVAALAFARTAIAVHLTGKSVPRQIRDYLYHEGAIRLAGIRLANYANDAAWQRQLAWMDDLIYSVMPLHDPEARPMLLALVPKLVRDIRENMPTDDDGFARHKSFLVWLCQAHLRALSPSREPVAAPDDTIPLALLTAVPATEEQLRPAGVVSEIDTLFRGDWCAFYALDDSPPLLARFAWRAPHGSQLLFTHRDGTIAMVHTPESLAVAFCDGTAKVVFEAASLFERAMERMIASRSAGSMTPGDPDGGGAIAPATLLPAEFAH
jgi:hypothetical protein